MPGTWKVSGWWKTALVRAAEHFEKLFFSPDFGSAHWFGGPEELLQRFPLSKTAQRQRVPYLPGDMLQVAFLPIDKWRRFILQNPELYLGGVAEPFWLNSLGAAVWVGEQVFVGR